MSDEETSPNHWAETNAEFELTTEKMLEELESIDDEEFQRRKEEMDDDRLNTELIEDEDLTREDAIEFFKGILAYSEQKRRVQADLRDVDEFEDDEWEDGFEYFERISGDLDGSPACLECRESLDPERDEIRVAADGAVVYTNCSTCGEDSLEDNRYRNKMVRGDRPAVPDPDDVDVVGPEDTEDRL